MYRTRPGLSLQGIGERPAAAHARGVPVNRLRYLYTVVGGVLVGVAGAAFTLDAKLGWSFLHTRNFGWIALAIVIFGGWHPLRVAAGVFLFGFLQWLSLDLQDVLPSLTQVLPILPFALMIFALVLVNARWLRAWADRHPRWGNLILGNAPSGDRHALQPGVAPSSDLRRQAAPVFTSRMSRPTSGLHRVARRVVDARCGSGRRAIPHARSRRRTSVLRVGGRAVDSSVRWMNGGVDLDQQPSPAAADRGDHPSRRRIRCQ